MKKTDGESPELGRDTSTSSTSSQEMHTVNKQQGWSYHLIEMFCKNKLMLDSHDTHRRARRDLDVTQWEGAWLKRRILWLRVKTHNRLHEIWIKKIKQTDCAGQAMRFSQKWVSGQKTIFGIKASLPRRPGRDGSGQATNTGSRQMCEADVCVETCVSAG